MLAKRATAHRARERERNREKERKRGREKQRKQKSQEERKRHRETCSRRQKQRVRKTTKKSRTHTISKLIICRWIKCIESNGYSWVSGSQERDDVDSAVLQLRMLLDRSLRLH